MFNVASVFRSQGAQEARIQPGKATQHRRSFINLMVWGDSWNDGASFLQRRLGAQVKFLVLTVHLDAEQPYTGEQALKVFEYMCELLFEFYYYKLFERFYLSNKLWEWPFGVPT